MMKKKLLAMALSATMVLGMAGCGAGNDGSASTNADASTGSQTFAHDMTGLSYTADFDYFQIDGKAGTR